MVTPRGLGGAVATALLVPGILGCSSEAGTDTGTDTGAASSASDRAGRSESGSAAVPELGEPREFRTRVEHTKSSRPDGLVDWRTDWVLTWSEVPGASGYAVRFGTSEGTGGRERSLDVPELTLDVAAGTSPRRRVRADRAAQLTLTASQLLVSVLATGPGGAEGPASPWYRVGEAPANGVPVPNRSAEHH